MEMEGVGRRGGEGRTVQEGLSCGWVVSRRAYCLLENLGESDYQIPSTFTYILSFNSYVSVT